MGNKFIQICINWSKNLKCFKPSQNDSTTEDNLNPHNSFGGLTEVNFNFQRKKNLYNALSRIQTLHNGVDNFYTLEYSLNFDEIQDFASLAEDPVGKKHTERE